MCIFVCIFGFSIDFNCIGDIFEVDMLLEVLLFIIMFWGLLYGGFVFCVVLGYFDLELIVLSIVVVVIVVVVLLILDLDVERFEFFVLVGGRLLLEIFEFDICVLFILNGGGSLFGG